MKVAWRLLLLFLLLLLLLLLLGLKNLSKCECSFNRISGRWSCYYIDFYWLAISANWEKVVADVVLMRPQQHSPIAVVVVVAGCLLEIWGFYYFSFFFVELATPPMTQQRLHNNFPNDRILQLANWCWLLTVMAGWIGNDGDNDDVVDFDGNDEEMEVSRCDRIGNLGLDTTLPTPPPPPPLPLPYARTLVVSRWTWFSSPQSPPQSEPSASRARCYRDVENPSTVHQDRLQ